VWLSREQRGSVGCSVPQYGAEWLSRVQRGSVEKAAWLSRVHSVKVQRGSVGCSAVQQGAAWLSRVQRGSVGCSVAQLVVPPGLLYSRPEFKSPLGTPGRFFPLSKQATETKERGRGEWRWMNV
jgi:hypothetical protein